MSRLRLIAALFIVVLSSNLPINVTSLAQSDTSGEILYQDSFDDNSGFWWTEADTWYDVSIENGKLLFDVNNYPQDTSLRYFNSVGSMSPTPTLNLTDPYQYSLEITATANNPNRTSLYFLFDVQPNNSSYKLWSLTGDMDGYWNLQDSVTALRGGEADYWENPVYLFDGNTHVVTVEVTQTEYRIFVDGLRVAAVASRSAINGSVGMGVAAYGDGNHALLSVDNFVVRQLEASAPANTVELGVANTTAPISADNFDAGTNWTHPEMMTVQNGVLRSELIGEAYTFTVRASPENNYVTAPFQAEFDFRYQQTRAGNGEPLIRMNFNQSQVSNLFGTIHNQSYLIFTPSYWLWGHGGDLNVINEQYLYRQPNPMFDGEQHRVAIQLQEVSEALAVNLIVDGEVVASKTWDVIFMETYSAYQPMFQEIDGVLHFAFGLAPNNNGVAPSGIFEIDNWALYPLGGAQLATGAGLGSADTILTTDIHRLSIQTPAGWVVGSKGDVTDIYKSNPQVYNLTISNSVAGVQRGGGNQVGITIYDPVHVMESTRIEDTRNESLSDVLAAFTARNTGVVNSTLPNQRAIALYQQGSQWWVALRASDDSITIAQVEFNNATPSAEMQETVWNILETLDYQTPTRTLAPAAQAVANVMEATFSGNTALIAANVCTADAAAMLLFMGGFSALADALASGEDDSRPYAPATPTTDQYLFDDSGMYYEIIRQTNEIALVRVMGNAIFRYADGTVLVDPQDTAAGPPLSRAGMNVYRVQNFGGQWIVCGGAFTF